MACDFVRFWPKYWLPEVAVSATSRAASSSKKSKKSSGSPIDFVRIWPKYWLPDVVQNDNYSPARYNACISFGVNVAYLVNVSIYFLL